MKESILLIVVIFLGGCSPDPVEPEGYWGHVSLNVNNEHNEFKPYSIDKGSTIDLHMDGFDEMDFKRFQLIVENLNKTEYKVDSFLPFGSSSDSEAAYLITWLDDGHVAGNMYKNLNLPGDYLEITDLDTMSGEIKGTFQFSFVVDSNYYPNDPFGIDTIFMRNGIFQTKW